MIDLHSHSTYSDGSLTPAELLKTAEEAGLKLYAITDHNSARSAEDTKDPAVRGLFSGKLLYGCELSTMVQGQNIEILGYGIEPSFITDFFAERRRRIPDPEKTLLHMVYTAYKKIGVRLDLPGEAFDRKIHISSKRFIRNQLLEHPENHRFFSSPDNMKDVLLYYRQELYNPESRLYVDLSPLVPSPEEIVALIHRAGGKAFLAHCFQYTTTITDHLLEIIQAYGIDGIECYYSSFTEEQTSYLIDLCQKNGLLISGGSDFHGALRPAIKIGCLTMNPEHFAWAEDMLK